MMRYAFLALSLVLVVVCLDARANLGPPPPGVNGSFNRPQPQFNFVPPAPQGPINSLGAKLVVVFDENAKAPRLQISQALFQQPGPGAKDARPGRVSLPIIVAGLALSLGIVSGGFWLLRNRTGQRLAVFLMAGAVLALGASVLWANFAPPPRFDPQAFVKNQVKLPAGLQLTEDITVEVLPVGAMPPGSITLIVPRDAVLKKDREAEAPRAPAKQEE
jgi:hypothetical protein